MKKFSTLITALSVLFLCSHSRGQEDVSNAQYDTFIAIVDSLREAESSLRGFDSSSLSDKKLEAALQSQEKAANLAKGTPLEDAGFLRYQQGRAQVLAGKMSDFESRIEFLKKVKAPHYMESFALATRKLNGINLADFFEERVPNNFIVPEIKRQAYCFFGESSVLIRWARPPYFPKNHSFPIYPFMALGYYDRGLRVFYEKRTCLLARYGSLDFYKIARDDLLVAEYAYRNNDRELAWDLLLEAGVLANKQSFEDQLIREDVEEIARQWCEYEQNGTHLPSAFGYEKNEKVRQDIVSEGPEVYRHRRWNEIINAYIKLNANPRAWELIDEYRDEFDNPPMPWKLESMSQPGGPHEDVEFESADALKERIQDDWKRFLEGLINTGRSRQWGKLDKVEVYGQVLIKNVGTDDQGNMTFEYPVKPLDVKIPWNLDESSLEQIKEDICRKLEEIAASEQLK